MRDRVRYFFAVGVISLCAVLCARIASAQELTPSAGPKKIILVVTAGHEEEFGELKDVIAEHTEDLGAKVEILGVEQGSSNILERIANVRSLLLADEAFFAIWIERSTSEVFLFVSNKDSDRVFLHTFPIAKSGWEAECDTIAALVRSALITWLDTPGEVARTQEEPPAEDSAEGQAPPKEPGLFIFYADAGYSFSLMHPGTTVHGADIAVATALWRYLEVRASGRFFQSEPLEITGENMKFHRLPFMFSLGARWPIGRHELGLRLALVVDTTYLEGFADSGTVDRTDLVHPGFSPSLFYRLSVWRFIYLWMELGPELYFHEYYYTWNGETVLNYGAVQGRASVGLAFAVDLGD